jgi:hypothetical protein
VVSPPPPPPPFPLLEGSLLEELSDLASSAEEARRKPSRARVKSEQPSATRGETVGAPPSSPSTEAAAAAAAAGANWEPLDFDIMFDRLAAYRDEHGHPNVPVKHPADPQLGNWVSGLRTKKKAYSGDGGGEGEDGCDDDGDGGDDGVDRREVRGGATAATPRDHAMDEMAGVDGDDDDAAAATTTASADGSSTGPVPSAGHNHQKYLNPERIRRLESLGFAWSMARPKTKPRSWEERLGDLRRFREENGSYNVPRNSSLGEWLHNQRTLYGKRDTKFMAGKAPRMVAIGYAFDIRENNSVSWDDRFQQLAEYRQRHGSADVPCPSSASDDGGYDDDGAELEERFKFYKWVNRLHNEYRGKASIIRGMFLSLFLSGDIGVREH